jgi:hypothetical protein
MEEIKRGGVMGKYEREKSENFEKEVCNYINTNSKSFAEEVTIIAKKLTNDFKPLNATWLGRDYSSKGDIKLECENSYYFIELKKGKSKGTLANVSQNTLTSLNIFEGVLSWKEFRKRNNFQNKVKNILVENDITDDNYKNALRKARDLEKSGNFAKQEIEKLARVDKMEYLKYLKEYGFLNKENLALYILNILNGNHKTRYLEKNGLNIKSNGNYFIYYLIKNSGEYIIENDKEIDSIEDNLRIEFNKDQTSLKVILHNREIIRFCFHWKNIFQGAETPCLNIFRGDI